MLELVTRGNPLFYLGLVLFFCSWVFCIRDDRKDRYELDTRPRSMPWARPEPLTRHPTSPTEHDSTDETKPHTPPG